MFEIRERKWRQINKILKEKGSFTHEARGCTCHGMSSTVPYRGDGRGHSRQRSARQHENITPTHTTPVPSHNKVSRANMWPSEVKHVFYSPSQCSFPPPHPTQPTFAFILKKMIVIKQMVKIGLDVNTWDRISLVKSMYDTYLRETTTGNNPQ